MKAVGGLILKISIFLFVIVLHWFGEVIKEI